MSTKRMLLVPLLAVATSTQTSCTVAKPFVCAVTTPVYVLANSAGGCGCGDPRGAACALVFVSMFGACSGLVTGIISDINWLLGRADDPTRNFYHPWLTNCCERG